MPTRALGPIEDELHLDAIAHLHLERMADDEFALVLDFADDTQYVLSFVGIRLQVRVVEA